MVSLSGLSLSGCAATDAIANAPSSLLNAGAGLVGGMLDVDPNLVRQGFVAAQIYARYTATEREKQEAAEKLVILERTDPAPVERARQENKKVLVEVEDYTIGQDGVSFSLPAGSDEIIMTREGL